ncbi:GNAT family N-acetyltransferase [candidate division WOR-3 bacterium]|nr:GNAT family N-acetyltransferase [candidate division WOR-3 bacterium]
MTKYFCEGNKVYLREVQLSDVSLIVEWKNDALIQKMALDPDVKISFENQERDVKKAIECDKEFYLIIVVKETEQPIGYIRIDWMDNAREYAWLRFALGEKRGQGYAKDALRNFLDFLFTEGTHRVEAEVYEFNTVSLGLLESLGFKKEGLKRKAHFDGARYVDVWVLGLLEEERNI